LNVQVNEVPIGNTVASFQKRDKDTTITMTTIFGTPKASASFLVAQATAAVFVAIVFNAAIGFKDGSSALAFYGVYHREPWNQFIHFFGVPLIIWTIFIMIAHLPLPFFGKFDIKIPFCKRHALSWATLVTVGYMIFFLMIDLFGGVLYFPVLYFMYVSAVNLMIRDQESANKKQDDASNWMGTGLLLKYAVVLHVLAWYVQIHPGHGIIEGAKPAVMKSFGGALTSAPLFAFYEGLWFLGINKGLEERTNELVAEYTAELCAAGASMRVCDSLV
jgi:uncharacterized membrane protein YGL010W